MSNWECLEWASLGAVPIATCWLVVEATARMRSCRRTKGLRAQLARVECLADHYEQQATELPLPHGRVTEAFSTAARDIRRALKEVDRG